MYRITNLSERALSLPVNYGDGLTTLVLAAGKSEDVESFGGIVGALKEQKLLEVTELPPAIAPQVVEKSDAKPNSRSENKRND